MDILAGKFKHLVHHHPTNDEFNFEIYKSYCFIDITKSKKMRELINQLISSVLLRRFVSFLFLIFDTYSVSFEPRNGALSRTRRSFHERWTSTWLWKDCAQRSSSMRIHTSHQCSILRFKRGSQSPNFFHASILSVHFPPFDLFHFFPLYCLERNCIIRIIRSAISKLENFKRTPLDKKEWYTDDNCQG